MRLDYFFRDRPPSERDPFRARSTWQPPKANPEIEEYLSVLPDKLSDMALKSYRRNLTRDQQAALRELIGNRDLVIKKADKGSCTVVENTCNYISDGLAHLADTSIYREVHGDTTPQLVRALNDYVRRQRARGYFSATMARYLNHSDPDKVRTQQMYFIKKLHKGQHEVRPIVSGTGGPTEKLSSFVDHWLKPLVPTISSYVRDSTHFINMLEGHKFYRKCILVTIDVKSLYLNIPHDEGIDAASARLHNSSRSIPFPRSVTEEMLNIILKQNSFEFNGTMYSQVRGTAMGTRMAPSYACIFMELIEQLALTNADPKPSIWLRYIDDIFMVWEHSREALDAFLAELNMLHPTIRFTHEVSDTEIAFLDVTVFKGPRFMELGIVDFRPHLKATNRFQYLHFYSSHPRSTFKGILKGELLRMLRASSSSHTFQHFQTLILSKFANRGYPARLLKWASQQVPFTDRSQALSGASKPSQDRPPFVSVHSDRVAKGNLTKVLTTPPDVEQPLLCFQRAHNVSDHLVRARLPGPSKPVMDERPILFRSTPCFTKYNAPCGVPLCACCKRMSKKAVLHSSATTHHHLPRNTDCNSMGLIYHLQCTRCASRNVYIGQTMRPLKQRLSGHRAAYLSRKNMPIYTHLHRGKHEFSDLQLSVLEVLKHPTREALLQAEERWISVFNSRVPQGLNSQYT